MTTFRVAMLSFVLLVFETTAVEGASAASAEISQRLYKQRTHSPPGIVQTRNYSNCKSNQHNTVNWKSEKCAKIMLVRRKEWGARESKKVDYLKTNGGVTISCFIIILKDSSVIIWTLVPKPFAIGKTTTWTLKDGMILPTNFLIGGDGWVYEGRGFDGIGAHTLFYNTKSVSFGFVGNYTFHVPNKQMLAAAADLILCGIESGKIQAEYTLHGQRDANLRDCPGDAFYALIQNSTHFGGRLDPYIYTPRYIDLEEINKVQ
uniref:Putative animal peptidoglycan recognition protein n=2 Tax=Ixodes ricinus TaxID=34613 RepID=V5GXL7_IXORI